jgi:predicted  nucleic acid-binding Zn-ribbon protein
VTARAELEALLRVQERDIALDRLRYRRASLPEREALGDRRARAAELTVRANAIRADRDAALAEERRLDDEAQGLAAKAKQVDSKLYSGTVSSPRELLDMQADIAQLDTHRGQIEEQELEVMERRESLDTELAALEAQLGALASEIAELESTLAVSEGEVDAEIAVEEAARAQEASAVSPALLADFERRRQQNHGAGVARLVGDTCQGCRLSIPATEVDRIRHDLGDEIASCDNCGAILVPSS